MVLNMRADACIHPTCRETTYPAAPQDGTTHEMQKALNPKPQTHKPQAPKP